MDSLLASFLGQERFLLLFLRMLGVGLLFPVSYAVFSLSVRTLLALTLALTFASFDAGSLAGGAGPSAAGIVSYVLEVVLGALTVLPFALTVKIFLMFGALLEQSRGQNLASAYGGSPDQEGEGQLGKLFEYGMIALLITSGLFSHLIFLLHDSLQIIPPGTLSLHSGWALFGRELLAHSIRALFVAGTIFLPFGMLFILSDLAVGFISKLVPGLPIFAEMFVVKTAITFGLLFTVVLPEFPDLPAKFHLLDTSTELAQTLFALIRGR
ncbi:flagellar biosynthetic protein FliR [bacterium]|nr:flagellar biosynthetic protein FliR [bacterium]